MGGERRGVVQCVDNLVAYGPARAMVLSVATRSEMAVGNVAVAVCVYVIGSFLTLHSGSVSPPLPKLRRLPSYFVSTHCAPTTTNNGGARVSVENELVVAISEKGA